MTIGALPLPDAINDGTITSVTDTYVGRLGMSYAVWPKQGLSISLGGRVKGIPVNDLIGGSDGYRSAGYVVSIEPGLAWSRGKNTLTLTAPVAIERNRQASVPGDSPNRELSETRQQEQQYSAQPHGPQRHCHDL